MNEVADLDSKLARMQVARIEDNKNPPLEGKDKITWKMAKAAADKLVRGWLDHNESINKPKEVSKDEDEVQVMDQDTMVQGEPVPSTSGSQTEGPSGAAEMSGAAVEMTGDAVEMSGAAEMTGAAVEMDADDLSTGGMSGIEDISAEEVEELLADEPEDKVAGNLFTADAWSEFPPNEAEIDKQEEANSRMEVPLRVELPSTSSSVSIRHERHTKGRISQRKVNDRMRERCCSVQHTCCCHRFASKNQVVRSVKPKVLQKCKVCMRAGFKDNLRHHKNDCMTRKLCYNPATRKSLCFICREPHLAKDCPNKNLGRR